MLQYTFFFYYYPSQNSKVQQQEQHLATTWQRVSLPENRPTSTMETPLAALVASMLVLHPFHLL